MDRSRRRNSNPTTYSSKMTTKTEAIVEYLEASPHEARTLPMLHSYLQSQMHRLSATSLTWDVNIKQACDAELAKTRPRIAQLPARLPGDPPRYKLRRFCTEDDLRPPPAPLPTPRPADPAQSSTSAAALPPLAVGTRVRARYAGRARWYPGTVGGLNTDGTYRVSYDDGDTEASVARALIRSEEGSGRGGSGSTHTWEWRPLGSGGGGAKEQTSPRVVACTGSNGSSCSGGSVVGGACGACGAHGACVSSGVCGLSAAAAAGGGIGGGGDNGSGGEPINGAVMVEACQVGDDDLDLVPEVKVVELLTSQQAHAEAAAATTTTATVVHIPPRRFGGGVDASHAVHLEPQQQLQLQRPPLPPQQQQAGGDAGDADDADDADAQRERLEAELAQRRRAADGARRATAAARARHAKEERALQRARAEVARLQSSLAAHAREVAAALQAEAPLAAAVASVEEQLEQLEQRAACHHPAPPPPPPLPSPALPLPLPPPPPPGSGSYAGDSTCRSAGGDVGGSVAEPEGAELPMCVD